MPVKDLRIVIKGAGEMASGVAFRLWNANFKRICMTDVAQPRSVRRMVSFSEAVYDGVQNIQGVTGELIDSFDRIERLWAASRIPVVVDPKAEIIKFLQPDVVVDAILAKKNTGTLITDAPLVIGLGPGFSVGKDVHLVVETLRGHNLGRLIRDGKAEENTGIPGVIAGYGPERVFRASVNGRFKGIRKIGDIVKKGDIVADVNDVPVRARINGIIRGMLRDGIEVWQGMKAGDIDAREVKDSCYTVSDKALAIAGGVLEGMLSHFNI